MLWLNAFALVLVLALTGEARAQESSETRTEFWPEIQAFIKLKPKWRIFLNGTVSRSLEDGELPPGQPYEALIGAHLDYLPNQHFILRGGYRYITSLNESDPYKEHRVVVEQHIRTLLRGDILLSDRNREDFRFINGDFSFRYRNRVTLEREFQIKNRSLTPYASAEIFYDTRFDTFNRNRFAFGLVYLIKRKYAPLKMLFPEKDISLDIYYMFQNDSHSSPRHVNGIGIALAFYY